MKKIHLSFAAIAFLVFHLSASAEAFVQNPSSNAVETVAWGSVQGSFGLLGAVSLAILLATRLLGRSKSR
ncbi:hypothetical protein [Pelagicoccus albus]|uniref:Uncharacterized protein n=1 Tax=Pelagicoccus albus TaxID=415222 RepID=A0A7X1E9A8_9BACT|nr:hypothetical protein [Pelagicoccus albus]MBC2607234.1 hypothetical protein [Pelagicoccus albus]